MTEEEARWFLALPEKVKSKRFSREEQVSLTAKCQRVLGSASPEPPRDANNRRRSVHRLEASACVPFHAHSTSISSSVYSTSTGGAPINHISASTEDSASKSRIPLDVVDIAKIRNEVHDRNPVAVDQVLATASNPADAEMETLRLYLHRGIAKVKPSEDNTKRPAPSSPPTMPSQPVKRKHHHRMHMLTPLPLPPPVLAPAPRQRTTSAPMSARLSRPFLNTDPLATEPRSSSEPDVRSEERRLPKLMVEGTVFELQGNDATPPAFEDKNFPPPVSAFSDYDSDVEDKDDDMLDTESVETIGPRTPSPTAHHIDATISSVSSEAGIEMPDLHLDARPKTASSYSRSGSAFSNYSSCHRSISSRELRTSEDMLYAFQRRETSGVDVIMEDDPLALESLPVCDDATGAKGAFSQGLHDTTTPPAKGLRKVFSSLKRL